MNPILHFLISYIFVELVFQNAKEYWMIILISSTFLDIDHLFYILENKRKIFKNKFGAKSRSFLHEFYGMFIFSTLLSALYFIFSADIVKIFSLSLMLHYALDFIIGRSRPFYPYSKREIRILPISYNFRTFLEIILTIFCSIFFLNLI